MNWLFRNQRYYGNGGKKLPKSLYSLIRGEMIGSEAVDLYLIKVKKLMYFPVNILSIAQLGIVLFVKANKFLGGFSFLLRLLLYIKICRKVTGPLTFWIVDDYQIIIKGSRKKLYFEQAWPLFLFYIIFAFIFEIRFLLTNYCALQGKFFLINTNKVKYIQILRWLLILIMMMCNMWKNE